MPTDQTAQAINNLVAQPVDKLATIIGILGMVLVVSLVFFGWRLFKYISNTDSPLVKVFREVRDAFNGLKTSQAEKSNEVISATRETNTILQEQTVVLKDFKNFQITNNDSVANLNDEVSALKTSISANTDGIADLKENIEHLSAQIDELIRGRADCAGFKSEWETFRTDILEKLQPPTIAVSNVVLPLAPANVTRDDAPAEAAKKSEAA